MWTSSLILALVLANPSTAPVAPSSQTSHSQPPPPTPPISTQVEQKQAAQKEDANAVKNPFLPPSVTKPDAPYENHPNTDAQKAASSVWSRLNPSNWSPNWIEAIFTIFIAGASFAQVCVYRRQADLMERGLTVTQQAADAASLSAKTTKRTLELSEKADVQMTDIHMSPRNIVEPGANLSCSFRNFGKTTALNVVTKIRLRTMQSPMFAVDPVVIAPSGESFVTPPLDAINPTTPFTQEVCDSINLDGKLWFVIDITYKDVFGNPQRVLYEACFNTKIHGFGYTSKVPEEYHL